MSSIDLSSALDKSIRFFLLLLLFWIPYSSAVVETCVVVSVLLWIIRGVARKDLRPPSSPLELPIGVFLAVCMLSTVGSAFWERSLQGLLTKTLEWFLIYWLVIDAFRKREHIQWALAALLISGAAVSLDANWQFHVTGKDLFFGHPIAAGERATASFKTANSLAGYLIVLLPLLYSLFSSASRKMGKWLYGILFLVFFWALAISYSRAAWAAALVGILIVIVFQKRKPAAGLLLLGAVVLVFGILESHSHPEANLRLRSEQILGAWNWRWGLWEDAAQMISTRPFFGHGINTFMLIFQEFRRKFSGAFDYDPTFAHNCYVQVAAETGLLGLLAFLGILSVLFKSCIKGIGRGGSADELWAGSLLTGLLGGLLAFLLHSGIDTDLFSLKLSALFWASAGLAMSLYNLLNGRPVRAIKRAH